MLFKNTLLALFIAATASAAPSINKRAPSGFNWGNEKVRGVNIGGWLLLEPWITPSIFEDVDPDGSRGIVDEYTLTQSLGAEQAYTRYLKRHWETWCTWQDFKKIADAGFNMVRIPIGYWAYDNSDSPYASGAAVFIDAAIDWARSLNMRLILDLHGSPGSQNGFDNSGQKMERPTWTQGNTVAKTLSVLKTIQSKYGASQYDDVIAGIELLNEPLTPVLDLNVVRQFTYDGFYQQRDYSPSRVVVFHDGFQPTSYWNGMLTPNDNNAQNCVIDHHEYQVFTPELNAMSPVQHRDYVCQNAPAYNGADKWTIIGEWSGAMTDCAKYLNGYRIGARYDGTFKDSYYIGSCNNQDLNAWSQQQRDDTRAFIQTQIAAYEKYTQGWIFWNFKNEGSPEWSAFALLDAGLFPRPGTELQSSCP
ncbi:Glucan 1,3-beta-glucosidase [Cercospora zeina]